MIALELVNSAIERVVDLASPDIHPLAKEAKDIAAGAVLVFAAASAIIGLLIFLPKWF
jgi:undecaprenol kinase